MTISTKGRYALRMLIDIAENSDGEYVPMKAVAKRQGLSLKYLERILPVLTQNGILEGHQGKGGGYRLTRSPEEYTVGEILRLAEGDLAPVACLECGAVPCDKVSECRTLPMWKKFSDLINGYFDGITLKELMRDGTAAAKRSDVSFSDAQL